MASRYWEVGHSYGYAGTESKEVIDVLEVYGWDQDTLDGYTDTELEEILANDEWDIAIEQVEVYAKPTSNPEE